MTNNPSAYIHNFARITNNGVWVDGKKIEMPATDEWLPSIYRNIGAQYPKFFKMDNLCKAGFLAAELIVNERGTDPVPEKRNWSVVIFNRSSSLDNDKKYQQTIADRENYYPSPSVFVYTLSNIVTGEIAIRHKIMGESCSYIQNEFCPQTILQMGEIGLLPNKGIDHLLIGWVEYLDGVCDVLLFHIGRERTALGLPWSEEEIEKAYQI